MNKTFIALAVLAGFAGAAAAQSSVTLSGGVDAGLRRANSDTTLTGAGSSRNNITFSGVEDLGNGNSAFFTLNHRFNIQSGIQNGQNAAASGSSQDVAGGQFYRNAFVGLKNNSIGDIRLGRILHPMQEIDGVFDVWGTDTVGSVHVDGRAGYNGTATLRANSTIYARTANFGGFVGHFAISAQDGGGNQTNSLKKPMGAGGVFTFGPATLAVAYDRNGNDVQTTGLYAKYNAGFAIVNVQYEKGDVVSTSDAEDTRVSLNASIPYGAFTAKIGYREMGRTDIAGKTKKAGIGLDYALSKRTTIYTNASKTGGSDAEIRNKATALTAADLTAATNARKEQFDIGVQHKF
jgi:predicted porin